MYCAQNKARKWPLPEEAVKHWLGVASLTIICVWEKRNRGVLRKKANKKPPPTEKQTDGEGGKW